MYYEPYYDYYDDYYNYDYDGYDYYDETIRQQIPGSFPGGFPGGTPGGFPGGSQGGYPGGQPGGFPGYPGGGGQQQTAQLPPPPAFTPQQPTAQTFAVDPGGIRRCLYRNTYVWLNNGRSFWFYPTFVGRTSIAGFRWRGFGWVYYGTNLRRIRSFQCF
ncbi:hypothetical protein V1498_11550 [Peribacillus sp. SCS-26]|uniref:hypothetical protein n=1 Tax=Paraperibacillus marinus TaxID=3115295 RepID=UPI003906C17E